MSLTGIPSWFTAWHMALKASACLALFLRVRFIVIKSVGDEIQFPRLLEFMFSENRAVVLVKWPRGRRGVGGAAAKAEATSGRYVYYFAGHTA